MKPEQTISSKAKGLPGPSESPRFSDGTASWKPGKKFQDKFVLNVLGTLAEDIRRPDCQLCQIDFSRIEWANPLSLLYLAVVLANSQLNHLQVNIYLGSWRGNPKHQIFIKFLAVHGFLNAFAEHATIYFQGKQYLARKHYSLSRGSQPIEHLVRELVVAPVAEVFSNIECISAKIVRPESAAPEDVQSYVELLISEANIKATHERFGMENRYRDILFQKLRKILFELVLNAVEHAYPIPAGGHIGIFATIRRGKPNHSGLSEGWEELNKQYHEEVPGILKYSPNKFVDWLEIYVCDAGRGLVNDIVSWPLPQNDPDASTALKRAQSSNNKLASIANFVFSAPFSRMPRDTLSRSSVTGLVHLGHLLSHGQDFCRMISDNGCVLAGHLPWRASQPLETLRERYTHLAKYKYAPGTAYAFAIQPKISSLSLDEKYWKCPDNDQRKNALDGLRAIKQEKNPFLKLWFIDRRKENTCSLPSNAEIARQQDSSPTTIVLRPPRLVAKNDISVWLQTCFAPQFMQENEWSTNLKTLVICELSTFQSSYMETLLIAENREFHIDANVILVSEDWQACALTTNLTVKGEGRKFVRDEAQARAFFNSGSFEDRCDFSLLIELLRKADSDIFWRQQKGLHFLHSGPISWEEGLDIDSYLDITSALSDPQRYRACRRALRRCLSLIPNKHPIAADSLVGTIVDELLRERTSNTHSDTNQKTKVIVGSIAVTSETAKAIKAPPDTDIVHLFNNSPSSSPPGQAPVAALTWITDLDELIAGEDANAGISIANWKRVPNTPFIAPKGEYSISIPRFAIEKGNVNFEKPLYARTAKETYEDFDRLKILKAGHWEYGTRHDLLTINTRVAFDASCLEFGPLYEWIKEELREAFSAFADEGVQAKLLVYPSHPTTDSIVNHLLYDKNFADILSANDVFPIKYLSTSTVSPSLVSPLIAEKIRNKVAALNFDKSHRRAWSAVILDDGVISGKSNRELTQFLQGLGAARPKTIALLDRSGLPSYPEVGALFTRRHKRFWRWDVPSLGHRRDCILCRALEHAASLKSSTISLSQTRRLNEWLEKWAPRKVETHWHVQNAGLEPTSLFPPIELKFGVYPSKQGKLVNHTLSLTNSTAATSAMMEITRLTTRNDIVPKKVKDLISTKHCNDPIQPRDLNIEAGKRAALEPIATQLILFRDELSLSFKLTQFKELLTILAGCEEESDATCLAGVTLGTLDPELLDEVWEFCLENIVGECAEIRCLDAILAIRMIISRIQGLGDGNLKFEKIPHLGFVALGIGNIKEKVAAFLSFQQGVYGNRTYGHTTDLRTAFQEIKKPLNILKNEHRAKLKSCLQAFVSSLTGLGNLRVSDICYQGDSINELEDAIQQLFLSWRLNEKDEIQENIRKLERQIYGSSQRQGLMAEISDELFLLVESSDTLALEFNKILQQVNSDWKQILAAKKEFGIDQWQSSDGTTRFPTIGFNSSTTPETSIYYDKLVRGLLNDIVRNVVHADSPIANPWRASETKKDLWVNSRNEDEYILFEFVNAATDRPPGPIRFKNRVNITGLERAGGTVQPVIETDGRFRLEIKIPKSTYFLNGG